MRIELASLGAGIAQSPQGVIEPGIQGSIVFHDGSGPVTVYATEDAGSGDTSGTFVTDTYGLIPGWVDIGNVIDITIPPGRTITTVTGSATAGPQGSTGPQGATGLTGPPGSQGPTGPPGSNFKGVWSISNTYSQGDWVFGSDDLSYNSVVNTNSGNDPTTDNGTHWESWLPSSVLLDNGPVYQARHFGLVADGVTDNKAAWDAMMVSLPLTNAFNNGCPRVVFEAGTYYFADKIFGDRGVWIQGQSGPWVAATEFTFADGVPGIIVDYKPGGPYDNAHGGQGGFILDSVLVNALGRSNPQAHGIVIRQTCQLRHVQVYNFGGDGVNLDSNIALQSNATDWLMDDVYITTCANGFYVNGGNAGAGLGIALKASACKFWSLIDNCNVANSYYSPSSEGPAQGAHTAGIDRSSGGWSSGFQERTWLAQNISSGVTNVPVLTGLGLPTAGRIYIDNETIDYTGISVAAGTASLPCSDGTTDTITYDNLTGCTRGANSTTAAAHNVSPFGDNSVITYIYWPQGMDTTLGLNTDSAGNNLGPALYNPYTESDYSLNSRWRGKVFGIAGNNPFLSWFQRATLTVSMGSGDTTATLKRTDGLPSSGTVKSDNEIFSYSGKTATTLTGLTRGINGTSAASHTADVSTIQFPMVLRPTLYLADPTLLPTTLKSGNWTFDLPDMGSVVECSSNSGQTFTIPLFSQVPFPVGTVIEVFQAGTGQITIAGAGGVTLESDGAKVKTAAQYSTIGLRNRNTNLWALSGDLA